MLEAGFAPTPHEVARRMLDLAELQRGEILCDLGSGDGGLLITATREFGAHAVGVEIQGKLIEESRRRIKRLGLERMVEVVEGDLFEADIGDADVLTLYLTPPSLSRLRIKLEREAKPVSRIVSYRYPIKGWRPKRTHPPEERDAEIYLYKL